MLSFCFCPQFSLILHLKTSLLLQLSLSHSSSHKDGYSENYLSAYLDEDVILSTIVQFAYWDYTGKTCLHVFNITN